MGDSDPTARIRIVPAGQDLIIEIVLKDGRSTLRRVQEPAALKGTLEALLVVPPAPAPADKPASPIPSVTLRTEAPAEKTVNAPPSQDATTTFGVELGGGIGGRVSGQGYLSLAGDGVARIRVRDWLFGLGVRWDAFQWKSDVALDNFEMETVGASISVARRLPTGFGSVDVGVSPRLVAETQSYLNKNTEIADTQTDVRLGGFTRAAFGHSPWRLYVEADGEFSPGRLRRDIRIDPALPPLPAWSAGLNLGAIWGQL